MGEPVIEGAAAGWWRRFLSFCYEALLLAAIVLLLQAAGQFLFQLATGLPVTALTDLSWARWINFTWLTLWVFAYFVICWQHGGQTLAMKTWRMRLVSVEGMAPTGFAIFLRLVLASLFYGPVIPLWILAWHDRQWLLAAWLASGWLFTPFIWCWFDRDRQLLHDRLAGTRLVLAIRKKKQNQPTE